MVALAVCREEGGSWPGCRMAEAGGDCCRQRVGEVGERLVHVGECRKSEVVEGREPPDGGEGE